MNKRFNLWTAATMVENKDYLNTRKVNIENNLHP